MNALLIAPIIVPMATAIAAFPLRKRQGWQTLCVLAGSISHLAVAMVLLVRVQDTGAMALQAGNWPAPFGITLVADLFSAIMVVITGIIHLAVVCYARGTIPAALLRNGFFSTLHILTMAISGAFLTGDLFNLYVWFEVMLMSSFGLLMIGGTPDQIRGGITYVALNLISTILFVCGIGMLYAMTGSLNMADLHLHARQAAGSGWLPAVAMIFMVAFGIKSAVFPLFFWLPAAYHTPPIAVSAYFSGLLTKVGVYAMIRVFTLVFVHHSGFTHTLLIVIAGLTMVTGVLGAAAQMDSRRILSFHIVSQIGYMIMGLGLFTPLALAGSVFYLVHHIIVKANLFLVSGLAASALGQYGLKASGGLYRHRGWMAGLFFIPAFSLAGVPPLSGFWAKLVLVQAGLEAGRYVLVATAIVVSFLTLYSMSKIWNEVFWKPGAAAVPDGWEGVSGSSRRWMVLPVAGLAGLTLCIGLWPEPFMALAVQAGNALMDPSDYVGAVLGKGGP